LEALPNQPRNLLRSQSHLELGLRRTVDQQPIYETPGGYQYPPPPPPVSTAPIPLVAGRTFLPESDPLLPSPDVVYFSPNRSAASTPDFTHESASQFIPVHRGRDPRSLPRDVHIPTTDSSTSNIWTMGGEEARSLSFFSVKS
jgi:hypothetical protein